MATDRDYLTNEPVDIYNPVPFPATYPPRTNTPAPTPSTGSSDGTVLYAAALFFNASCQSTDRVGSWVRADTDANSVTTTDSSLSFPAVGVIVTKSSDTACVVQTYGLCKGVYSGLTPNLRLFVGPSGQATAGSQLPSGTAYVQPIGFSVRSDTIFVQPSGTLYRRDAAASSSDPAPTPQPSTPDSVSTYRAILGGQGAPDSSIGQLGDAYIASDTLLIYLRDSTGWDDGRQLATGAAAPGPKGDPGKPGSIIVRVAQLPSDYSAYNEGDFIIADNGDATQVVSA